MRIPSKLLLCLTTLGFLGACGILAPQDGKSNARNAEPVENNSDIREAEAEDGTIWDAFKGKQAEQRLQVNRYLWTASLDVLSFLPIESVDPFSGLILTGYGTPPGGGQAYRATVHIQDPALEARSLNLALQTSGGRSVSTETVRAVEDAILSRARQLRIADKKF